MDWGYAIPIGLIVQLSKNTIQGDLYIIIILLEAIIWVKNYYKNKYTLGFEHPATRSLVALRTVLPPYQWLHVYNTILYKKGNIRYENDWGESIETTKAFSLHIVDRLDSNFVHNFTNLKKWKKMDLIEMFLRSIQV